MAGEIDLRRLRPRHHAAAVLAVAIHEEHPYLYVWEYQAITHCGSVVLAVAAVLVWSVSLHSLAQFAALCAVAILVAFVDSIVQIYFLNYVLTVEGFTIWSAYYLIQAIIVAVWLGAGQILPISNANAAAANKRR